MPCPNQVGGAGFEAIRPSAVTWLPTGVVSYGQGT